MIAACLPGAGSLHFRQRPYGNATVSSLWRKAGVLITLVALAIALMAPSWLDRQKSNPFGELADEISIAKDVVLDDIDSGAGGGPAGLLLQTMHGFPDWLLPRRKVDADFPRSAALAPKPAAFIVPLANGPPSRRG